jgi:hypothetical protein
VLAAFGLVATRNGLHAAIAADSGAQADTTGPGVGHVDHRLHAGVVAAILAVVVLVAMLVSVAVVWHGPAARPTPPQPRHGGGVVSHPSAARPINPLMDGPGESRLGTVSLASITAPLAAGTVTAIDLGDGVTLTLAPGWTISNQGQSWANVFNNAENVGAYASTGRASTPDINQESALDINQAIQAVGLTNVQQTAGGQLQTLQGKNFQQLIEVDYTGNVQTNQGTQQEWGAWITLYNPTARTSGSFVFYAWSPDAFKAAIPDAGSMLVSME